MFSQIFDAIEEWMRELLTGMISSNLDRKFLYEDHVCTHYGYLVCPYDRNLPLYLSCTDSVRNDEQQRVGTDLNKLFQRTLCPGVPGFSDDLSSSLFGVMAYTVILCFSLFKTGSLSKSIFNAH